MSVAELPDDATHEQIQEFVTELVAAEKAPAEEKATDEAAPVSEPEPKETSAGEETPADSDTVVPDKDDEGQAETDSTEQTWLDDDTKGLAAAYGIESDELKDFQSRDEFSRALGLLDRQAIAAGKQIASGTNDEQPEKKQERAKGPDGRFLPKAPKETEAPAEEPSYKVELDPDDLDSESVIKEFNKLRDHYEGKVKSLEGRFSQIEQIERRRMIQAETQQFDAILDSMGETELFGTTGKETPAQMKAREQTFLAHKIHVLGLSHLGRQGQLSKAFVERAARAEFPDHFSKQQRKQLTQKLTKQSSMRMGGGATKPVSTQDTLREEMRRKYEELEKQG